MTAAEAGEGCNQAWVPILGLQLSGVLPSAVLHPFPCRAHLWYLPICQEEVGADSFPKAQADGGILLFLQWWHSLRQQDRTARGRWGRQQAVPAPQGEPTTLVANPTCRSCPS